MKVIVIGAGIIGALTAYRLVQHGAEVLMMDAGQPASAASGASFGWINASYYLTPAHFRLRHSAIAAHRRLADDLGSTATKWQECLCWEESGADFDAKFRELSSLGYGVRVLDRTEIAALEPEIKAPARALLFVDEGAVDLVQLTRDALTAACSSGARLLTGMTVQGVETTGGAVSAVRWSGGVLPCDGVVLAAGTGTSDLCKKVGVTLPMLDRPGVMMRSAPVQPLLAHILVTPEGELRQDPTGRILAPTAAAHQGDTTEKIEQDPGVLADRRARQISELLQRKIVWEEAHLAYRPVPQDGLPVMGECGPAGFYVCTMHSGATLAPLAAEIVAAELCKAPLTNLQTDLVAPYRPERFTK